MVGRGAPLRALAATALVGAALSLTAPHAQAAPGAAPAPSVRDDDSPLEVTIDTLSPAVLPRTGTVTIEGTVTNRDDETWTTVNVYAFFGDDLAPMRSAADLAAAAEVPAEADVGDRITDVGTPGKIESLDPGDQARYTVTVPARALHAASPGVYWFGVHASGQSASHPRDDFADGKARTFLPYLPDRFDASPLPTALVLPVQHPITYAADGSVADPDEWLDELGPTGRLRGLVGLAQQAAALPLTYLLDPAVLDAIAQLAHGNPARSLGPTAVPGNGTASPSPTADPTQSADPESDGQGLDGIDPDELPDDVSPLARAAATWLDDLAGVLPGSQVLGLPYGNLDLPAAMTLDREAGLTEDDQRGHALYQLAVAQRDAVLADLDVEPDPAVSGPDGFLDLDSLEATGDDTTALLSDRAFKARHLPTVADVDGHTVVTTSSGFEQGGPGPTTPTSGIALRQRLLSEVAVRLVNGRSDPLVVVLPDSWTADDAASFVDGIHVPWLDPVTVHDVVQRTVATSVDAGRLRYPERLAARETPARSFDAVERLIARGDNLQSLLTDNNEVGGAITEQALTALGYDLREVQPAARRSVNDSTRWVRSKLDGVEISAPRGVTLASDQGSFAATLINRLDQPVTVSVLARSDEGLTVRQPSPVTIAPRSRTTVLLRATATTSRVHNVTLLVTDADGHPIGPSDQLPIRSAQVSDVIWLIMGTGAGLLFLAIIVRLVRRVRAARRGAPLVS